MADNEPFDSRAILDPALELITSARADLIQTLNTYNSDGQELTGTALERLQQLNDPPVSPVRTDAVAGLSRELKQFDYLWIPLVGNAGLLLLALETELSSLALTMMGIPAPEIAYKEGDDALGNALAVARAHIDAVSIARRRNEVLIVSAAAIETVVAEALQEIVGFLMARLNLLAAFMSRVDPAPKNADIPATGFRKFLLKTSINEATLLGLEELLEAAATEIPRGIAKELPTHIPLAGIAVSVIKITQDVRERKKTIHERRELLEEVAAAYFKPNVVEDMSILLGQFQQDDTRIEEFFSYLGDLTNRLISGLAE
jgi:hypothetical protein